MSACARAWSASKMTQDERRLWLIRRLLAERADGGDIVLPTDAAVQKRLLRSLFNLRPPRDADAAFLREQDAYLRAAIAEKGITDAENLVPLREGLCLWQGDITTLRCDAMPMPRCSAAFAPATAAWTTPSTPTRAWNCASPVTA